MMMMMMMINFTELCRQIIFPSVSSRFAESHFAESHFAESRFAECRVSFSFHHFHFKFFSLMRYNLFMRVNEMRVKYYCYILCRLFLLQYPYNGL